MQPRLFVAFAVYVGSYFPLSVILFSQNLKSSAWSEVEFLWRHPVPIKWDRILTSPWISMGAVLVCLACLIVTLFLLRAFTADHGIKIVSTRAASADLLNYVLPYVVSFMSLNYTDSRTMTGFAIFMFWLFWITYKSGQIIMNPLLTVFGWRLYDISYRFVGDEVVHNSIALSRTPIEPNGEYLQRSLQDVLIVR